MSYGRAEQVVGTTGTLTKGAAGSGAFLDRIVIGKNAASAVVTVYNGTSTSGEEIAQIDASAATAIGTYEFCCYLENGLHVTVTGGAAEITVITH